MNKHHFFLVALLAFFSLSFKTFQPKIPDSILKSFQKHFPDAKNVKWEIDEDDDDKIWEAEFKFLKKKHSACFDINGNLLETEYETNLDNVPSRIIKKMQEIYPKGRIKSIEHVTKNSNIFYEIEIKLKKDTYEVLFNESGDLIKSEIE